MIKSFGGINISSKDLEKLARFYNEKLGIPILGDTTNGFDGVEIGFNINEPIIWISEKNKWGKLYQGTVTFVYL